MRMLTVLLLGFSSGLPLALTAGTLQAWFKCKGVDIVTIGFLGLIGQPYSYKYLWAPLMDKFAPSFLGRRKGWMFIMQILIIVMLCVMAFQDPTKNPIFLGVLAFVLAFFSASQDIAIDAYRVDLLDADERGLGAALAAEGYRLAMITSGGGALILADHFGWQLTYIVMASFMLIGTIAVFIGPEPEVAICSKDNFLQVVKDAFFDFLQKPTAVYFLFLIIFYKMGDAFSHTLSTAFLLDMDFSLTAVGTINKVTGLIASLIGIFFGGLLMTRWGLFRSLLLFGILQGITNLLYMVLSIVGKNYLCAISAFFVENLCGGMGTAAFTALLMSLCNTKFSATQYALFSSIAVLGRVYVGPVSGKLVACFGWTQFYFLTAVFAIPGIVLVWLLRNEIAYEDQSQKDKQQQIKPSPTCVGEGGCAAAG